MLKTLTSGVVALLLWQACITSAICPVGDFSRDCFVDFRDLQILSRRWLKCRQDQAHLQQSAVVNSRDYALVARDWLTRGVPLCINEFLASNGSCGSDQAGEYDDWLEIYNAGDTLSIWADFASRTICKNQTLGAFPMELPSRPGTSC